MSLVENLNKIKNTIPANITLVAVSKTKPVEDIQTLYNAGQRVFGENKVQEMVAKQEVLPKDIEWHLIGNLQRNKVKYIAPFVSLIHSVDSYNLLKEINKQAKRHERIIPCLLQIKIAQEESKYGLDFSDAEELLTQLSEFPHIEIQGLMGMSTFTDDMEQVKAEFQSLKNFYDQIQPKYPFIKILSMGMSGDYPLAIELGSNMVRVGSSIFGERNYP